MNLSVQQMTETYNLPKGVAQAIYSWASEMESSERTAGGDYMKLAALVARALQDLGVSEALASAQDSAPIIQPLDRDVTVIELDDVSSEEYWKATKAERREMLKAYRAENER